MKDSKSFKRWQSKLAVSLLELFVFLAIEKKPGQLYAKDFLKIGRDFVSPSIKVPTLYALLNRCEEHNFLQVEERRLDDDDVEVKTRGTARKYYTLTELGEFHLDAMKAEIGSYEKLFAFEVEGALKNMEGLQ